MWLVPNTLIRLFEFVSTLACDTLPHSVTVWLKLSDKDLQLSAVVVVTVFFQGKRSRRDLKFFTW